MAKERRNMIKRFQDYIEHSDWDKTIEEGFDRITGYLVVVAFLGGGAIIAIGLWNIYKAGG